MSLFNFSKNGLIANVQFGNAISLEASLEKLKSDAEEHAKELEFILSLDDKTSENPLIASIVEDAVTEAKEVLKKIDEIEKAIIYWRARGKDTSKTYENW